MAAPWSAATPTGLPARLPAGRHGPANTRPLTDEEYERAWKHLYASTVTDLTPAELAHEIARAERERALLAADLAAGDSPLPTATLRHGIAFWDAQLAVLNRQAQRLLRATLPPPTSQLPAPNFDRARYADLVGLAESLTGSPARKTGPGRYRVACPFHDDREPSLVIYPPGQGWWCFVCQRGGPDATSFAAAFFGCTQIEGLRWVETVCDLPGAA